MRQDLRCRLVAVFAVGHVGNLEGARVFAQQVIRAINVLAFWPVMARTGRGLTPAAAAITAWGGELVNAPSATINQRF